MDIKSFYLASDIEYSLDLFRTYVAFIEKNWNNLPGRPTVVFLITQSIYGTLPLSISSNPSSHLFHICTKTEAHQILNSQLV